MAQWMRQDLGVLGKNWQQGVAVKPAAALPEPSVSLLALVSLAFIARVCRSRR